MITSKLHLWDCTNNQTHSHEELMWSQIWLVDPHSWRHCWAPIGGRGFVLHSPTRFRLPPLRVFINKPHFPPAGAAAHTTLSSCQHCRIPALVFNQVLRRNFCGAGFACYFFFFKQKRNAGKKKKKKKRSPLHKPEAVCVLSLLSEPSARRGPLLHRACDWPHTCFYRMLCSCQPHCPAVRLWRASVLSGENILHCASELLLAAACCDTATARKAKSELVAESSCSWQMCQALSVSLFNDWQDGGRCWRESKRCQGLNLS